MICTYYIVVKKAIAYTLVTVLHVVYCPLCFILLLRLLYLCFCISLLLMLPLDGE